MSTRTVTATSSSSRRITGTTCALGGALITGLGLSQIGTDSGPPVPGLDPWMGLTLLGILMTGVGVVGAAAAGLLGDRPYARVGLGVAVLGVAVFAVGHALAFVDGTQSESPLFPIGQILEAAGMIVVGIAVLRAGRWSGWGRWTPLICGLYPFVILMPAFAIFGAPNFPAIAGFGATWLLFGVAVATAPDRRASAAV